MTNFGTSATLGPGRVLREAYRPSFKYIGQTIFGNRYGRNKHHDKMSANWPSWFIA